MSDPIVVVGGGASGTLLAVELLRQSPAPAVVLVEPRAQIGRGLAYGAAAPEHRLNVRASRMSARADDPDHFVRWLGQHEPGAGEASFARREDYGRYLAYALDQARIAAPGSRVAHVRDRVSGIEATGEGYRVLLSSGPVLRARRVVLAFGPPPSAPFPWPLPREVDPRRFVSDPWSPDALEPRARDEGVLLMGTGLTAIDVALARHARGQQGPIVLLSRRGLLPRIQAAFQPPLRPASPPSTAASSIPPSAGPAWARDAQGLRALARALRTEVGRVTADAGDWHDVFETLRPAVPALWAGLSHADRRAFLRHLQPYWDVHRHRLPAEVAESLERMRADGQLEVRAGRVLRIAPARNGVRAIVSPRGSRRTVALHVARVVNCTGPALLGSVPGGLVAALVGSGLVRVDPLGLGLDAGPDGSLLRRDGCVALGLYAMGPLLKGVLWETTAIPEIRAQAAALARTLAAEASGARRIEESA